MSSVLDFINAIVKSIWNLIYAFCNFREASGVVDLLRMIQSIFLTFETPMLWRWNFHNYVGLLWLVCDCKQIFCWRFMELIFLATVTHKGSNKKSCQNPRLDCDLYSICLFVIVFYLLLFKSFILRASCTFRWLCWGVKISILKLMRI